MGGGRCSRDEWPACGGGGTALGVTVIVVAATRIHPRARAASEETGRVCMSRGRSGGSPSASMRCLSCERLLTLASMASGRVARRIKNRAVSCGTRLTFAQRRSSSWRRAYRRSQCTTSTADMDTPAATTSAGAWVCMDERARCAHDATGVSTGSRDEERHGKRCETWDAPC